MTELPPELAQIPQFRDIRRNLFEQDNCAIHGPEPIPDPCFRVCRECGHAFETEEDLIQAELSEWPGDRPVVEEIYSCPYCSHDW